MWHHPDGRSPVGVVLLYSDERKRAVAQHPPQKSTPTPGRVFIATESGTTEIDGQTYSYTKGITRVREGHPLLKVSDYFEPATEHVHYEWETR